MRSAVWSSVVVAALLLFAAKGFAQARPADCLFEIGGAHPIDGPCQVEIDGPAPDAFQISTDGGPRVRYFAAEGASAKPAPGHARGLWNEAPNAQPPRDIGELAPEGACWIGAAAKLCLWEPGSRKSKPVVEADGCCALTPAQINEPSNTCMEMSGLPPLEAKSTGEKPIRFVVEALLHDAETVYTEGAHVIARKPQTESEAVALSKMAMLRVGAESFPITECNFQFVLSRTMQGDEATYPEDMAATLQRIGQFDNLLYNAVKEALSCSNAQAQFDLALSRQMLDHAWLEFNGHPEQRGWTPDDLAVPQTRETCIENLPKGVGLQALGKIIDAEIQKFQKEAP
jgi:hypothetical protein